MSVAFFILIMAVITAYSLAPLLRPKAPWLTASDQGEPRRALLTEKESYLRAMKDIEFEHASAKINDADYKDLRLHYGMKAAKTIRALEELEETEPALAADKQLSAKQAEETTHRLTLEIAAVKEDMKQLKIDWYSGVLDDDGYISRHDEYTVKLEELIAGLEKVKG